MSKRNTIEYVCYNEECKHNDKGFCQLKGIKPSCCINAMSKQGYELGIEWRDKEINRLKHQLALTEKALELACEKLSNMIIKNCINIEQGMDALQYCDKNWFLKQAEQEVENELQD